MESYSAKNNFWCIKKNLIIAGYKFYNIFLTKHIHKMKRKTFFLTLLFCAGSFIGFAQNEGVMRPDKVSKAVAFGISKPLTEIKTVLKPDNDLAKEPKEVYNFLEYDKWGKAEVNLPADNPQTKQGTKHTKGMLAGFSGIMSTGSYPPDTDGDVSSDYFVQVVNSKYAVFEKNGNRILGPLSLSTLWDDLPGPWVGTNNGDPIILFDEEYERWVITQFSLPSGTQNYELFAVSQTSDPTGAYYLYAFAFGVKFNDYPKIGVWSNGYTATYNLFSNNSNPSFIGSKVTMVDRSKMVNGEPDPAMIEFTKNGWYSTMPADVDGSNMPGVDEPCPVMYIRGDRKIVMMELMPDWDNPATGSTLSATNILTPNYFTPRTSDIIQPNGQGLDHLGNMIMNRLAYRKFDDHASMVVNHTVQSGGKAAIRWYEFRKTGTEDWSIYQQGTYAPGDGANRWMGSAAINANGDIAIGYSIASEEIHPSIGATARSADDPLGEMTMPEIVLKQGTSSQASYDRWGDYSCMNVDPSNGTDFWYTTEYNGWRTWIASFNLGESVAPTVSAGEDNYVCKNKPFQCNGNATAAQTTEWTTSGDGAFMNANTLTAKYIRGNEDLANGSCVLTLTVNGYNGDVVSDDMTLYFNPYANAGEDITAAAGSDVTLSGISNTYNTILWTTDGTGTFSDNSTINTIYTPGIDEPTTTNITLKVVTDGCSGSATDNVAIHWNDGVEDVENTNSFRVYPNPTNEVFTLEMSNLDANESLSYTIHTATGREIFYELVRNHSDRFVKQFDMSKFKTGIYFVTIRTNNNSKTLKIVKQ